MLEQNDYKNLYKEIVTNLLEGVMVISMKGKITMLNPAAERILGLTQEDIGNSFINVFLTREGTDDFNEVILDTIYEKDKVSNMPVDYMLEGETRNLSLTTSYIHSDGEKSVVVVMEDVTELNELRDAKTALDTIKKLNREYEKAKDEAVRANEAKSLFLSNMSHEIRTPINAVLGMNEMILRECKDEQLLSYAANVQSSGKTLLFLINDILDMSKIESGKMEIVKVEYELENLLMDLWNIIFLRAQEKGLSIRFLLDETLPRTLFGDDVRIKQIVTNLLTNAVKYTPQGGIEMRVAYEKKDDEELTLIISVKDTGMGIRQEDMGKLFESFQRLDEEKNRNIEGTGLGMNITMSLLKLMDGEMTVESEYGKGSEFTVTIPQRIVCEEPVGDFETVKKKREKSFSRKSQSFVAPEASVLVVDDNSMNLTVFKSLLKRTKMKITTADSGRRCLELIKQEKFHIIFMDHMMPEMDGIETLHEIQKLSDFPNEDTPVIVLTANAMSGAREGYLKEGFADFLTKPIDGDILEQTVERYLPENMVERPEEDGQEEKEQPAGNDYEEYLSYGISIANGLSLAKNDEEMYLELVKMFLRDRGKQEEMRQFIENRNGKDYAIWVHGLKGNARTLGADMLADMAFEHEKQSKAGNMEYVETHWEELLLLWEKTLEGFQKFIDIYGGEETDKYGMAECDGEILRLTEQDFAEVADLLEDFETDKAVERLKAWLGSPLETSVRELVKNALIAIEDDFDEDRAIELLKAGGDA
ncbi:MAG: response regulator [Alistipes sp.]|nr:response regulator [Alistipes sp.]